MVYYDGPRESNYIRTTALRLFVFATWDLPTILMEYCHQNSGFQQFYTQLIVVFIKGRHQEKSLQTFVWQF